LHLNDFVLLQIHFQQKFRVEKDHREMMKYLGECGFVLSWNLLATSENIVKIVMQCA
jgi:hypothetical protein